MDKPTPGRISVKLKPKEHVLAREIADAEGRSVIGVLTLALRLYGQRKQPALMKRLYGEAA